VSEAWRDRNKLIAEIGRQRPRHHPIELSIKLQHLNGWSIARIAVQWQVSENRVRRMIRTFDARMVAIRAQPCIYVDFRHLMPKLPPANMKVLEDFWNCRTDANICKRNHITKPTIRKIVLEAIDYLQRGPGYTPPVYNNTWLPRYAKGLQMQLDNPPPKWAT
jgi:hypothetical protein